jgi:hypothetical protein
MRLNSLEGFTIYPRQTGCPVKNFAAVRPAIACSKLQGILAKGNKTA